MRLTKRDEYGNADIIGVDSAELQINLEFNGLNLVTAALNKLAAYEDAEAEGRLVVLPCKVGDTVYTIEEDLFACDTCPQGGEGFNGKKECKYDGRCPFIIKEHQCEAFDLGGRAGHAILSGPGEWGCEGIEHFIGYDGKYYFNLEEAEAALAAEAEKEDSQE